MPDVLVLGAGMVGVSTALALQAQGQEVILVDRTSPGRETSYGNAGLIQAEAAEPYAFPRDLASLLRTIFKRGNDVNYHLDALSDQWRPLWGYFRASAPARHEAISRSYAKLTRRSTADHAPLIAAAGAENLIRRDGFRKVFRSTSEFEHGAAHAERVSRQYDLALRVMNSAELAAAEPALKITCAGACHWLDSWSCIDPGGLTQAYADLFVARGGRVQTADAGSLQQDGRMWSVGVSWGRLAARHAVVALGPWSPLLLEKLGYRIPLLRKRGYHRHYKGGDALNLPMLDVENGTALSPMTAGFRVLTGAEIARLDAPPTPVQMVRAEKAARELLNLGEPVEAEPWLGTRPCMPDMLPLVGAAPRHEGLWFHFGHGHQGFTLGPTTAALLAEEMQTARAPMPELSPRRLS
ncbi:MULTISPECIES: FAD-dependent oxidoreductase [unclassified Beijerinckia]|uniref:NAD(P)/FAD-dependent oxidoreductase n=1 Tax=unclassified Beijerinckia TaxID=2638183 RepID=UPI0008989DFF|nr:MULTISPECIES: FAD-dependent oxidoreductase [unclassified Beijerinckia]MDH7793955.1 D-amino-acid dehydrogenase [Beijerinckia sp. GAS462]SEB50225.1 D-amino-acid dehydrogenase [Beijerinckia sp. 28-YEA-48]